MEIIQDWGIADLQKYIHQRGLISPQNQKIVAQIISRIYPALQQNHQEMLIQAACTLLAAIIIKFDIDHDNVAAANDFWQQLVQNDYTDLRAIINMLLPHIDDDEHDTLKKRLTTFNDLYVHQNEKGAFTFTNLQYNRCIRSRDANRNIKTRFRPFQTIYFEQHLMFLLASIESVANKLYVNWVDVLPITITNYPKTRLYKNTLSKMAGDAYSDLQDGQRLYKTCMTTPLLNGCLDFMPGLSYQDYYNTISNYLYHDIANIRWLTYEPDRTNDKMYIDYLQDYFDLNSIQQNIMWDMLSLVDKNLFQTQWVNFLHATDAVMQQILADIYFYFAKYHVNTQQLIQTNKFKLTANSTGVDVGNTHVITPDKTVFPKAGFMNTPAAEIYAFFYAQINAYKKTWYYQATINPTFVRGVTSTSGFSHKITVKNIYSYAKSLIHYNCNIDGKPEYVALPKFWKSLTREQRTMFIIRINDTQVAATDNMMFENDWQNPRGNWFNINNNIKRAYPDLAPADLPHINFIIHANIRENLPNIVMECLIYAGILVEFKPNPGITSLRNETQQRAAMKQQIFADNARQDYLQNSCYYLTGEIYADMKPMVLQVDGKRVEMHWFDYLVSMQTWTFMYAMNWVSQVNFFHHYENNRVMFVTGSTGVGKSTQVPKLLHYAQKMLDYVSSGKIVCTQPRVHPTIANAATISTELGVPIMEYSDEYRANIPSQNYNIQYKHQNGSHVDATSSFIRITTDGTLFQELKNAPFSTHARPDKAARTTDGRQVDWLKTFTSNNKYDIIIVDEAHEHNSYMDMILTLGRNAAYVNNTVKIVIVSATMTDDEPRYRRYYRDLNDNRKFPLDTHIQEYSLDRCHVDRRVHISPPGATTRFVIQDNYLTQAESDLVTHKNYVERGIEKTIAVVKDTSDGDVLVFMAGESDIHQAVREINEKTPHHVIALGYYSKMAEQDKQRIRNIHVELSRYTRRKQDVNLDEAAIAYHVPPNTYTRAVIIATNVAEASITLVNLRYVIDTGYSKNAIYDPATGMSRMMTLPISNSSSVQRRGRVGRVAPGKVYYMYSNTKLSANKTMFGIADQDAQPYLQQLIATESGDWPMINSRNDINNIKNLAALRDLQYQHHTSGANNTLMLAGIIQNPACYLDIIRDQYTLMPDLQDIMQYYTYYGCHDTNNDGEYAANHQDYNYQMRSPGMKTQGFTGFSDNFLRDKNLQFYLVHPDENVIGRNMYTGRLNLLAYNPAVSAEYYGIILRDKLAQHQGDTQAAIANTRIADIQLHKIPIAFNDLVQQQIFEPADRQENANIIYRKLPGFDAAMTLRFSDMVRSYSKYVTKFRTNYVTSHIYDAMMQAKRVINVTDLMETNNLLWYCYGMVHEMQYDVLALVIMMNMGDITNWYSFQPGMAYIKDIVASKSDDRGDLYVIWKLWLQIKPVTQNYTSQILIGSNRHKKKFQESKHKYINNKKMDAAENVMFRALFAAGKLNNENDFYHYVKLELAPVVGFDAVEIANLATSNRVSRDLVEKFIDKYCSAVYAIRKNVWLSEYETQHGLAEIKFDLTEWVNKKLRTLVYFGATPWDHISDAFARTHCSNLLWNQFKYFVKMDRSLVVPIPEWIPGTGIGKTLARNLPKYLLYYTSASFGENSQVIYLLPVNLDHLIKLAPYFFANMTKTQQSSTQLETRVARELAIMRKSINYNLLIDYAEKMFDAATIRAIRRNTDLH